MFDIWAFEFSKSTFENWVSAMHLHVPFMASDHCRRQHFVFRYTLETRVQYSDLIGSFSKEWWGSCVFFLRRMGGWIVNIIRSVPSHWIFALSDVYCYLCTWRGIPHGEVHVSLRTLMDTLVKLFLEWLITCFCMDSKRECWTTHVHVAPTTTAAATASMWH